MANVTEIDWRAEPCEQGVVTRVDGRSISYGDHWGCGWPDGAGDPPVVGDHLRVLGRFGGEFYGMVVNDELRWYLTPAERTARREKWLRELREKRERAFAENEAKLDADYDALPIPFRIRIDQLRAAGGQDWRIENEAYEMFVCVEAVKMADHFGSRAEIARWYALPYDQQKAEWDGFDSGHSGNTFGCAASLAAKYLDSPDRSESVVVAAAAISPIGGDPRYDENPSPAPVLPEERA